MTLAPLILYSVAACQVGTTRKEKSKLHSTVKNSRLTRNPFKKNTIMDFYKRFTLLLLLILFLSGCSAVPVTKPPRIDLPPVLSQDELQRPYTKLGRIQVIREVYFTDGSLDPNLHEWGHQALREEAYKMGADALIFPEISSRQLTIVLFPAFPATEYRASGTAIKFR